MLCPLLNVESTACWIQLVYQVRSRFHDICMRLLSAFMSPTSARIWSAGGDGDGGWHERLSQLICVVGPRPGGMFEVSLKVGRQGYCYLRIKLLYYRDLELERRVGDW